MTHSPRVTLLVLVSLAAILGTFIFIDPIPQWPEYHQFVDDRELLGIPNALNVLSNLPFLFIGAWGLWLITSQPWSRAPETQSAYLVFFTGVLLTAFGSSWYHLEPANHSLVWDRLPMAVVATAFLSISIGEFISPTLGRRLLGPMVFLGIASVAWWAWTESNGAGDLRAYGLTQFLPGLLVVLMMILFRARAGFVGPVIGMIFFYALAKLFETYDAQVFDFLLFESGHTLKHLAAAAATACLLFPLSRATK